MCTDLSSTITFLPVGNAVTTVKSKDNIKIFTIRGTAFEAAEESGGTAATEQGKLCVFMFTMT